MGSSFKHSKGMGQNFLIDENISKKIVSMAGIDKSCGVLEIGPGMGALTVFLCKAAGRVTAVELDSRLLPFLSNTLAEFSNFDLIHGNIMKMDVGKIVEENMQGFSLHACANLPYNITTPLLTLLVDSHVFISLTVMVQREVAQRICAVPGSREYGALSVYSNYHTVPNMLFDVAPECFSPCPKVWSTVISLKPRSRPLLAPDMETAFFKVVRAVFNQRRKTLVNSLFSAYANSLSKSDITSAVMECGFDSMVRGETLGFEEFSKLALCLTEKQPFPSSS